MQSDIQKKINLKVNRKVYLLDLSFEELSAFVGTLGLEQFRARQIFRGIYVENLTDFAQLTTIPKSLRQELDRSVTIRSLKLVTSTTSVLDGTVKFLWELADGLNIESVIIHEGKRITFCISSQVGCALDCKFCATGKMGFLRNLSSGEIVEQVLLMKERVSGSGTPTNIVFMGMGEPLLNLRNVLKASYLLADPEGLTFSRKKITISTSGMINGIRQLADLNAPFSLAISLNAVFQDKRQQIMPMSILQPLAELQKIIYYYVRRTRRRVTFEYIMINNINDTRRDAGQLLKFTARIPCKINLIPCNSSDPEFPPPDPHKIIWFREYLNAHQRTAMVRLRKGWEIQAACGQLYARNNTRIGTRIGTSVKINRMMQ
jgi:23S rRNA (adenine2503-C2)-methyltransferase